MAEGFELPETGEEHGNQSAGAPCFRNISILAVSHRGSNPARPPRAHGRTAAAVAGYRSMGLLPGEKYPPARNAKHGRSAGRDHSVGQGKNRQLQEKYAKEVERYNGDKENISDKAKDLEKERDIVSHRADRFDGGEALLEIGLVICSITLLTKRRGFWIAGIACRRWSVLFWQRPGSCLH